MSFTGSPRVARKTPSPRERGRPEVWPFQKKNARPSGTGANYDPKVVATRASNEIWAALCGGDPKKRTTARTPFPTSRADYSYDWAAAAMRFPLPPPRESVMPVQCRAIETLSSLSWVRPELEVAPSAATPSQRRSMRAEPFHRAVALPMPSQPPQQQPPPTTPSQPPAPPAPPRAPPHVPGRRAQSADPSRLRTAMARTVEYEQEMALLRARLAAARSPRDVRRPQSASSDVAFTLNPGHAVAAPFGKLEEQRAFSAYRSANTVAPVLHQRARFTPRAQRIRPVSAR